MRNFLSRSVAGSLFRRQVPVIRQLNSVECGAACLAMVLRHYGRKIQVAEIREACSVGRDGLSALTILKTARAYGLRTRAYSVEPEQVSQLRLPAIIHWGFNHFVVVESWSARHVEIIDPAQGRRRVTRNEFNEYFTGVILTMEPGEQFQAEDSRNRRFSPWKYFRTVLSRSSAEALLAQILAASFFLQCFGLVVPAFTKLLVDYVIPIRSNDLLAVISVSAIVMVSAHSLTTYLRSVLLLVLKGRLDTQLMLGFAEHLLSLPFTFFQERTTGDLAMRLGSNSLLREVVTNQLMSVLLDGFFLIVYLAILMIAAPGLGALVLALGSIQAMLLLVTHRRVYNLMQRDLAASAEQQGYLIETITGVAFLKASGAEDSAFDRWSNLFFKQLNISIERGHIAALLESAILGLRMLSPVLLLWMGARYVLSGSLSVGTMLGLNGIAIAFVSPLATLIAGAQQLQVVSAYLERIVDVLEAEPEQLPGDGKRDVALSGRVEVRGVNFQYNREAPPVLKNISCVIHPGQKVAIVGSSGSGKSTLALLILGLVRPDSGEIFYDDMPLGELNYQGLRGQFGVVLQDPMIFSGSIRENLAFGAPGASLEELVEAAQLAGIHGDIIRMPMGYETLVSEGGSNLSGGQRQRLAIARALARRPAFLILDEATSHLDLLSESLVDRSLSALSCTRIVIAHRLSTIRNADQILVLNEGSIVERGTHDELVRACGHYAELLQTQESAFVGEAHSAAVAIPVLAQN
jgi:ABC-type bacteriocin/lantibiotic exporter with double-glycine peptidase domain